MTPEIKKRIEQIRRGEVPEGYKRTKAGIIPLDWEIHDLSQHLSESRIPGSNGAVAKKLTVKLWNKGVYEKREIHEGSESTTYYKRKAGQFIYSKLDFLNCAFGIIPNALDGYESTQDLPCFDICGVNPYYLLTYVTQKNFYTHFGMIADGGRKARRVGPSDMLSFPLIYPSLIEQERIAEILSAQDKIIALKEKLLEEKKRQKKALMQQLLTGKKRLPGFVGEWKEMKLGDICSTYSGGTPNRANSEFYGGDIPWIKSGELNQGDIYYTEESLTRVGLENSSAKIVPSGTLLIAMYGATAGALAFTHIDAAINQAILALIPSMKVNTLLLKESLMIQIEIVTHRLTQGGQPNFNASIIKSFKIILPSIEEQDAIANIAKIANDEISLLQKEIDQEKQKKKALMQLLLSGIVRA